MTTIESWYSSVPEFPPRDGRWGALLSWAYATWNPGALHKLPQILMKYQGVEDELMGALADKYDPQLAERRKLTRAETKRANILKNLPPPPAPPGPGSSTVPAEPRLSAPQSSIHEETLLVHLGVSFCRQFRFPKVTFLKTKNID